MFRIFLFLAAFCAAVLSPVARADSYAGLDHINRIIAGTPGITTAGLSGGTVGVQASGSLAWTTSSGYKMSVPLVVEADVGAAAIAAGAARILSRAVPWVGAALLINDVYNAISDSGLVQCSTGGVCQSAKQSATAYYPPYPQPGVYTACKTSGGLTTCLLYEELPSIPHGCGGSYPSGWNTTNYRSTTAASCGWVMQGTVSNAPLPAPTADANGESDVTNALTPKLQADPNLAKKIYDEVVAVEQQNPSLVVMGTDPLDIRNAPIKLNTGAVASPSHTISTTTITNPDGTTSTVTKTEVITVTPNVATGATVANPGITLPSQVQTTTTTTNNATGQTTTQVDTNNVPDGAAKPEQQPLQIPTDYNRENTQQAVHADTTKIAQELDASGAADLPDQSAKVASAQADSDTKMQGMRDQTLNDREPNESLFYKFLWTPPVGTCTPYTVGFRGFSGTVDFCGTVGMLRDILGWLMALGSALSIYNLLFRNSED